VTHLALAGLALVGAVLALRSAWMNRSARGWRLAAGGVLFAAATALAAEEAGWERGVALACVVLSVPALAAVAANAGWRPRRRAERADGDEPSTAGGLWLRWVLAGPGGGLAAAALAGALAGWLPAPPALRTVLAVLALPLVWAFFAGWGLGTGRPRRVLFAVGACAICGAGATAAAFA